MKKLERGDTIIVWKLDRLGPSLRDLIAMLDDLKTRGVKFQSLTEAIDTTTPTGLAMWQMIGGLAELERSLISERTRAGVKEARRPGVKFGRRPKLSAKQIDHARKLIDSGQRREDVAALLNVDRTTLYRALAPCRVNLSCCIPARTVNSSISSSPNSLPQHAHRAKSSAEKALCPPEDTVPVAGRSCTFTFGSFGPQFGHSNSRASCIENSPYLELHTRKPNLRGERAHQPGALIILSSGADVSAPLPASWALPFKK